MFRVVNATKDDENRLGKVKMTTTKVDMFYKEFFEQLLGNWVNVLFQVVYLDRD